MLHGRLSPAPLERGQLALIDLTPQVDGYCANLARTFVLGEPDERQAELIAPTARSWPRSAGRCARASPRRHSSTSGQSGLRGATAWRVPGLRHRPRHRAALRGAAGLDDHPAAQEPAAAEGMTVTIGHTVLAIPGFGGVGSRTSTASARAGRGSGSILFDYPIDPIAQAPAADSDEVGPERDHQPEQQRGSGDHRQQSEKRRATAIISLKTKISAPAARPRNRIERSGDTST
jgi:hypothetical protein